MSNRRKPVAPSDYSHLISRAVKVPIFVTLNLDEWSATNDVKAVNLRFWLVFYGLTSKELLNEHIRTAMARRGLQEHQYHVRNAA
jgi:hypothetical protein